MRSSATSARPSPLAPRPGPYAGEPLRRFLLAHAVPGLEDVETDVAGGTLLRRFVATADGRVVEARLTFEAGLVGAPMVELRTVPRGRSDRAPEAPDAAPPEDAVAAVRHWLDLDADPAVIDASLGDDPVLAPLVSARPGLRVPGAVDPAETALFAVLGQQVSLAAARTFQARLVSAHGRRVEGSDLRLGPDPAEVAAADTETLRAALGITGARVRALQALAAALASGLDVGPGTDRAETRAALLALPGIGPWTADYLALRCFGDRDAFLPGDLVLRRAMSARTPAEAARASAAWSPWRAYASLHLWTAAVFAG